MKSTLLLITALAFSLALASNAAMAMSSDRDQPAQIEADETEIDFKTGTRILTNNVIVIQGTLRLKADKLVANYNKQGELIKAVANGSLARFKQRPDGQTDDVEGWGKTITIDYPTNTLTLIGKAALKQGGTTANGDKIVYNMATDKLKIMGGSTLGTGGKKGKPAPARKIKDPFADDVKSTTKAKPTPNTKGKSTVDDSSNTATASGQQATQAEPEVEPAKAGRSRLILQPRKKTKTNADKEDEE